MDPRIFNTLRAIQQADSEEQRAELKARSNDELAAHFQRQPQEFEELAYDLLNIAWSDAYSTDILQRIIEVKTVGLGDTDYIDEDLRGMRAYFQGKGGQILSDMLRYERTQMPREEIVAAIDLHQDEVTLDFWGAFGKLQSQAREKMGTLPIERLVELIAESVSDSQNSGYYGTFAKATLTDTQVDTVIDAVADKAKGRITIMGSRIAIRHLADVGLTFGDNIAEEIFKTGVIGVYKGYPVVAVENFENFEGELILPKDELWIVGQNAGRLTYYGSTAKVQQLRLPSFWLRWESARDAGLLLFGASKGRLGRIVLT